MSKNENILRIPSTKENIAQVEKWIDDLSARYDLGVEIYGRLTLALIEAVNNAISHGNKLDINKLVTIEHSINDSEIEFIITDCGDGFNFNDTTDPTLPENVKNSNGRGIFLMKNLADEVEFLENGSVVKLKFSLDVSNIL